MKSKELTAADISHAALMAEAKVLYDIHSELFIHSSHLLLTVAVNITRGEQAAKHEDDSGTSEHHST